MKGEKIEIGRVNVPEQYRKSFKCVGQDGTVYAVAQGSRGYTESQRKKVDEAAKKARAGIAAIGKKLRTAEADARKQIKKAKDPSQVAKALGAYERAVEARKEYEKSHKDVLSKAVREARKGALK